MFSRAANAFAKSSARRMRSASSNFQRRAMGGGGAAMEGSPEIMHQAAEVFGVITWLWVFSRARADLPWILGFRHPWDHPEDPFDPNPHGHHGGHESSSPEEQVEAWNKFTMKSIKPGEDDDDDEDEDEENEDEEEDDDE